MQQMKDPVRAQKGGKNIPLETYPGTAKAVNRNRNKPGS
jgi:hypothetical protein